jgi:hypothetical protein
MNFLFRKLFRNTIPPAKEGDFLVRMVSGSAYQVFLDGQFRKLSNFEKQSQIEKDRIFNELVVTALILLVSAIRDNLPRIERERQEFWQTVYEKIPDIFIDWLNDLKVEKNYVDIWRKLIDMRWEEYQEKQSLTRGIWIEELIKNQDSEKFNDAAVRVETLTVSSMLHITRGKAQRDDPLRKHLRTWLAVLNNKLEERIGW